MTQIHEINTIEEFRNLKEEWNELLARSSSDTIFLRHEWLFTWWEVFGKDKNLFILVVRENEKIVGIAPLMIVKTKLNLFPVRAVKFIGEKESDRADFIIESDSKYAIEAIVSYLINNSYRWDIVWLKEILEDSAMVNRLQAYLSKNGLKLWQGICSICPYISLDNNWNEFWKSLKPSLKRNLRNRNRRLSEKGEVKFERYNNGSNVNDLLSQAIYIERKSWKGSDNIGIFHSEDHKVFHKRFADISRKQDWFDLSFLSIDSNKISFHYGFKYKNKFLSYNTSYDPLYSKESPGVILMHFMLQDFFREGIAELDLLNGEQSYKLDWTSNIRQHIQFMIFKKSFYSHILYRYQATLKPLMKKIKTKRQ
jgi:CelD/BcsL family acetyltransferase involved in cellulose biosynthesis